MTMDSDSQWQNSEQRESRERLTKRGPWSAEEDHLLMKYMKEHAHIKGTWQNVPLHAGLMRSGKSCRLRWLNYLHPNVKTGGITPEEEDLIIRLHKLLGNRWSLIARRLPERTDNEIKNYWKSHIKKRLTKIKNTPKVHCRQREEKRMEENPKSNDSNNLHEVEQPIQNVDTPFDVETNQMATSSYMCLHDNVFEEENTSTMSSTYHLDFTEDYEMSLDFTLVDTTNTKSVAGIIEEARSDLHNPFDQHISWIDEYMEASQIYDLYPEI